MIAGRLETSISAKQHVTSTGFFTVSLPGPAIAREKAVCGLLRKKAVLVTSCLADIVWSWEYWLFLLLTISTQNYKKTTARVSYQRICVALAPRILIAFQLAHWATDPSQARTTGKCGCSVPDYPLVTRNICCNAGNHDATVDGEDSMLGTLCVIPLPPRTTEDWP